jgi:hypothetical protein
MMIAESFCDQRLPVVVFCWMYAAVNALHSSANIPSMMTGGLPQEGWFLSFYT